MAMETQYLATSLPNSTYRDFVLSYVGPIDHYVLVQTGQYKYTGYVWNIFGKNKTIQIERHTYGSGVGAYTRWETDVYEGKTEVVVTEPLFAYSTDNDMGVYYAPSSVNSSGAIACVIVCMLITVLMVMRGIMK